MKFSLNVALLFLGSAPAAAQIANAKPMQTFFIPLPEQSIFDDMFEMVNPAATAPVESLISFAISTDNTIIWYDHWEGGYEDNILQPKSATTEIWGDGNALNGCAPDVNPCSNAVDKLMAGDSIVIQNTVPIPRSRSSNDGTVLYDGGDMVAASYPIAVTRGCYPSIPGSLMAGAVEVLDTDHWGQEFVAPVGENMTIPGLKAKYDATEYTALFMMAAEDATTVVLNGNPASTTYINKGKGAHFRVKQGDRLSSDKPIQVDLVSADLNSSYELRWFSLIATNQWSSDYTTPVGDTAGQTRCILYNDGSSAITVNVTMRASNTTPPATSSITVPARGYQFSSVIPQGSGAQFKSTDNKPFITLSFTDSDQKFWTGGQWFDWGFPVVPTNMLTPQVLIGWGYGCTNNNCKGETTRSVVWLTPVADADFYIDYNNTGIPLNYEKRSVDRLVGIKVTDEKDKNKDMSGAFIFAVQRGSGVNGTPVDFAAAWGQDPLVSEPNQPISLDLGTVVLPFSGIRITKVADKTVVFPGDTLKYTIRILNVGQVDIGVNEFTIVDPPQYDQKYVPGTTTYSVDGGKTKQSVLDDTVGTPFPLDGTGMKNAFVLPRRGGTHEITFDVQVDQDALNTSTIINTGYLQRKSGSRYPFEANTKVDIKPGIDIENTVYLGQNNGASCNDTAIIADSVTDVPQTPITYCFKVTNTGRNWLKAPYISNDDLKTYYGDAKKMLKPGDSYIVSYDSYIGSNSSANMAVVKASVVWASGVPIDTPNVTDGDPSNVVAISFDPKVTIDNKVFAGVGTCAANSMEEASGFMQDVVTYCFNISNTGNTYLKDFTVTNQNLKPVYSNTKVDMLAPGEWYLLEVNGVIDGNYTNTAIVVAKPVRSDGRDVPSRPSVTSSDTSSIVGRVPPPLDVRSGDKDPYSPPAGNETDIVTDCMTPHWQDGGGKQDLICRADDITVKSITSNRANCKAGENVTVSASASLLFKTALYDPAWFVAVDGGDAKMGRCALKGLVAGNNYAVTDPSGSKDVAGSVVWNSDNIGGNDKCGDVQIPGGSAIVTGPFLVNVVMKCEDTNDDGNLDFAVCFSWRAKNDDSFCTLTNNDIDTKGALADVFPANQMKCRCVRVEVPTISVEKKSSISGVKTC